MKSKLRNESDISLNVPTYREISNMMCGVFHWNLDGSDS
ncbi:hypothetical protein FHU23_000534 [Clostridium saccharobutylicum]|uniref:Uncharacterized protein n=1 Tax=Clostridium saccharobutylicum DSM 13864 TaxID=1345695 RepID=U5MQ24_CLOSA|nr:hypothetical protein CLSA_c07780 [Clostridium saccharobutylicum DSM 13864]MBA2903925.1 hypothetical protein [Clostridium saccharobutylicum]MBA8895194.1 hypothetical protein [Clostridium saccharobutylicum]MBA8982085.1 hypothetical protein [Clostridium saccharobutylicum]MBA9000344.1 hypothetical protein [Clostridium saccharobutylicum]